MAATDTSVRVPIGAALGMVETHGLVAAIEAADAMVKAASVQLIRQQRTVPAMITHFVVGDVGAVQAAVSAAEVAVARIGRVVATHVIARPAPGVWKAMVGVEPGEPAPRAPAPKKTSASKPAPKARPKTAPEAKSPSTTKTRSGKAAAKAPSASGDYADRTVRELRTLARDRDDDRLSGRDIASASKSELVAFLRESE